MNHDGGSHVLNVSVAAEEARSWLWCRGSGGLLPETRGMDVSDLLVESLSSRSPLIRDPRVLHGALGTVFGILKLAQVMVNPLWSASLPVATL